MNYLKTLIELYRMKKQTRLSPEKMKKLQDEKLRKLLHYAWDHSVYYRRTFEGAGITRDQLDDLPLSCFPTLNKQILLEHFDEVITLPDVTQEDLRRFDEEIQADRKPYEGKYHVVHSSGSTGKPGYFIYDQEAWSSMLLGIIRGALWNMTMPQILRLLIKRPRIVYIAATDGRYGGAMAVGDGIDGVGAKQMYLDIKTPLPEWVEKLKKFRPNIVIGYPSAIKIMAELVKQGEVQAEIEKVISCGEPLGISLRNYLEKIFQTPVINIYGASESLALGVETDPKEGMILFDDLNVIEMEKGVMYLTSLYNYAQPLIRYRLSDHLTLQAAEETDPWPFTRAVGMLGRNEDILWFENGSGRREFLHPLAIEGFCIEGLKDYQFCQTAPDAFEMYAQIAEGDSESKIRSEMMAQMGKILREKHLDFVQFCVKFVEEILPDPGTGKKPLILPPGEITRGLWKEISGRENQEEERVNEYYIAG